MARNTRGQITHVGPMTKYITKRLQQVGNEVEIRVKPLVRDEAARILRAEVYDSYQPITTRGKATQEYNETHKHQQARPYHHTGRLVAAIYGTIEGNSIKLKVSENKRYTYANGKTAAEVYDMLKFGTTKEPKNDTYSYGEGEYAKYTPQPPHYFEARAKEQIDAYLDDLGRKLQTGEWRNIVGINRYVDKVAKKNR